MASAFVEERTAASPHSAPGIARALFFDAVADDPQEASVAPALGIPMLLSREAAEILEEHGAEGSETSSACLEHIREVLRALRAAGATEDEQNLSYAIEVYTKDLIHTWQREAAVTGSIDGVAAWAAQVLVCHDFSAAKT